MKKSIKRVLVAGEKSGCGKSLITNILISLIAEKIKAKPHVFKCGPDYLDPLFCESLNDVSCGNLDSFFCGRDELISIIADEADDEIPVIIEGVMGYYDGIDNTYTASTAQIAYFTDTPVILVMDAHGSMQSILAKLYGFVNFNDYGKMIKGVILNNTSKKVYERLKDDIIAIGILPLGFMPKQREAAFPSRYLGLVTPEDKKSTKEALRKCTKAIEVDIDAIAELINSASRLDIKPKKNSIKYNDIKIAVARDEAFLFLYKENLRLLKQAGADIIYFSPIHDKALPECDGLILCGGYPEGYAKELSENITMRESIREAILNGLPAIAECGGFLYLHRSITTDKNKSYELCGVIDSEAFYAGFPGRFGYEYMYSDKDFLLARANERLRVHEFHYYDSKNAGEDAYFTKPQKGSPTERRAYLSDTLYAGFAHIPFMGNKTCLHSFLGKCVC